MIENFIKKINYNPIGFFLKYILFVALVFFMWQHMYIYMVYTFVVFFVLVSFLKSDIKYKPNILHNIAKGNKARKTLNYKNIPNLIKIKNVINTLLSIGILYLAYKNSTTALVFLTPVLIVWFCLNIYLLINLGKD